MTPPRSLHATRLGSIRSALLDSLAGVASGLPGAQRILLSALATLCGLCWATSARAYRPFDSTDAAVANLGDFELELGPVGYLHTPPKQYIVAPNTVLNLGFARDFEFVLQANLLFPLDAPAKAPSWQMQSAGVFVKTVLREGVLQDKSGPSIAAEMGTYLPNVNGVKGFGPSIDVIISERWSFGSVHLNLNPYEAQSGNADFFLGLILEGPIQWPVRPVVELIHDQEFGARTLNSALGGAIWHFNTAFDFDVAARVGKLDNTTLTEIRAGLTWAISLWQPTP